MKPSALIYASALLASLAEAAPLRVVVVTNAVDHDLSQNLRFGHAVPHPLLDTILAGPDGAHNDKPTGRPCMMRKMAMKAVAVSNTFRKAVGLPLIEDPNLSGYTAKDHGSEPVYGVLPFIGTPPTFVNVKGPGEAGIAEGGPYVRFVGPDGTILIKEAGHPSRVVPYTSFPPGSYPTRLPYPPHHPPHHHHRHHHKHHRPCHRSPFLYRLNSALLSLGRWEGRAVAFVLGCGLGVLLRMFWVLSVITFRAIKGTRREEVEYTIIHEYINEAPAPPPSYPVDEKAEAKKDDQIASA